MQQYQDYYFHKAKAENYPARSVYKLKEIDGKYHILHPGVKALDLGAAPGSWSLYAAEKAGEKGLVIACDLNDLSIRLPGHAKFLREDVFNPSESFLKELAENGPFDLVMSDMAPATTGNKLTDQVRSFNLASEAFSIAQKHLRQGGNFVVKIFMGPDIQELLQSMRKVFQNVKTFKPKSSRSESKETFFIGLNFQQNI